MNWKERLYKYYVSSSQAGVNKNFKIPKEFPYGKYLLKRINNLPKSAKIADLGCGYGRFLAYFKNMGYVNLYGVDFSKEQVEIANLNGLKFIECDTIMGFLLKNDGLKFELIILFDVIEHLEKQELFDLIEQVYDKLLPNGRLVIHVPNGEGLAPTTTYFGDFTHVSAFTQQSIRQILLTFGFSDIQVYEDKPIIHSLISFFRFFIWEIGTIYTRIMRKVENPLIKPILSQNLLAIAQKNI